MSSSGMLQAVLYCLQFSRELGDEEVERLSRTILEQPFYDLPVTEQYSGIEESLAVDLGRTDLSWQPHEEPAVRDFLRRLLDRLDALRPWPEPPFRSLGTDRWEAFTRGTLLARVRLSSPAQDVLHARLRTVAGDAHGLRGLVLRLGSGDEVALVAPPSATRPLADGDEAVLMAAPPHRPPQEMVEAFLTHTLYPRERVTPALPRRWWRGPGGALPPGVRPARG
ncbi:hypothetical protein [Streptomyces sp. NPDC056600]|uniref:hypothetical protein n=1 Tax=Streptomyces sp. NPDC056600 TaxID=3345874 RepID=UPI003699BD35